MKLDLERHESGRSELPIVGTVKLAWADDRPDEAEISGNLRVDNLENRFILKGTLTAGGKAECSRCLSGFELAWKTPVECMVLRDSASEEGDGNSMVLVQRSGEVDLGEVIRECVILSYPLAPLCGPECKGLCASCGVNLNEEDCDCVDDEVDPRWEGLP